MERMKVEEAMKVCAERKELFVTDFGEALAWVKDGGKTGMGRMEPWMYVDPFGGAGRYF